MAKQVNVKLTIAEVTKDFANNVGINWQSGADQAGTFVLQKFKFNAEMLGTTITAISDDSVARVLAEPNLSVLSGETADFLVGGEFPIAAISGMGATSITYKDYGIKLMIGAKVEDKNRIRVLLQEEVSTIGSDSVAGSAGSYPILKTRRAKTTVELADGESFLLGGLMSTEERESLSKIPVIGHVPILGALFRNTSTDRKHTELVVVATVNLVKPIAIKDIVLPDFMRTSTTERFFNFSGISKTYIKDRL